MLLLKLVLRFSSIFFKIPSKMLLLKLLRREARGELSGEAAIKPLREAFKVVSTTLSTFKVVSTTLSSMLSGSMTKLPRLLGILLYSGMVPCKWL
jgi:hypothetical protein